MINNINTQCPLKTRIANQLPNLISRIGRSTVYIANQNFTNIFNQNIKNVEMYLKNYEKESKMNLKNYLSKNLKTYRKT